MTETFKKQLRSEAKETSFNDYLCFYRLVVSNIGQSKPYRLRKIMLHEPGKIVISRVREF